MEIEIISYSPHQTRKIGREIGKKLSKGDTVALYGKLGSGKTTLIQGIARGLEVKKSQYVRSPSFVLINQYEGRLPIYHIDLYRLTEEEVEGLGLEEYLLGDGVCIIEWAEKMQNLLPKDSLIISLEFLPKEEERKIKLEGKNRYQKVIKSLQKGAA